MIFSIQITLESIIWGLIMNDTCTLRMFNKIGKSGIFLKQFLLKKQLYHIKEIFFVQEI